MWSDAELGNGDGLDGIGMRGGKGLGEGGKCGEQRPGEIDRFEARGG